MSEADQHTLDASRYGLAASIVRSPVDQRIRHLLQLSRLEPTVEACDPTHDSAAFRLDPDEAFG